MLVPTNDLLHAAQQGGYAIGAFNVYNLEGARAVVNAAEQNNSPAMLQIHPAALLYAGTALLALCVTEAREASVPMAVHLDHSVSTSAIRSAVAAGFSSVMADGSHLDYEQNVTFTREMVAFAHQHGVAVEAELGRISGTEDGLTVSEFEARFTDPDQARSFVEQTNIDALAVCIGNVHGHYHREPNLDFERLALLSERVNVPLVLHGASGLADGMVHASIRRGIVKLNVNTEIRQAFLGSMRERFMQDPPPDLVDLLEGAVEAMTQVVADKLHLFGSVNKA